MNEKSVCPQQILVVEHDCNIAGLTQKRLREWGFQVDVVDNGAHALQVLTRRDYDAILLNYSLPDERGDRLAKKIRHLRTDLPQIIINRDEDKLVDFQIVKSGDYDFNVNSSDLSYLAALPTTVYMSIEWQKLDKEKKRIQDQLKNYTKHLNETAAKRIKNLMHLNKNLKNRLRQQDIELQEVKTQLMQASKLAALGTLGAGVAHELNNPLTVVSAEADEILDSIEDGCFDKTLAAISAKNIKTHAERMRVIIDHIRTYTREDKHSEWQQLSINEPIKDALILLKNQLDNLGIEVELCLNENIPRIWGNHNQLESVFQNFITNARDAFASIDDGREKKLTISTYLNGKDKIEVKFADNAGGMSEQVLSKIFKPFFTTKEIGNGTGLGLSIAQRNVQEHRGDITVKSKLGQGSEFTLTFPLERRNQPVHAKS